MDLLSAPLALKIATTATYKYIGEAGPGSLTGAQKWRIQRLTIADNTIVWADGNGEFDNVWDDYASLTYA